jgi:hypothetical protein
VGDETEPTPKTLHPSLARVGHSRRCWADPAVPTTRLAMVPERMPDTDPLQAQAAQAFAGELAAGRVPSVRVIRPRLDVGQLPAQRVRAYLVALNGAQPDMRLKYPAALPAGPSAA